MSQPDIILAHPIRTAIGAYNGTLKGVPATELGEIAIRETLRRAGISGEDIGSVVMGNVIGSVANLGWDVRRPLTGRISDCDLPRTAP